MPTLSIERRDLSPQPFLFVRAKAGRHEIAKAIADALGKAFPYAMQAGLAIAGRPTARYLSTGPGLFDMQIGVPLAATSPGHGDVQGGELPGGPFAVGVHAGSYDSLSETYVGNELTLLGLAISWGATRRQWHRAGGRRGWAKLE